MLLTVGVTTVKMLKVDWSTSYYTVPQYNHIGTHTTYKHWSTSGNALGKLWDSSGMHPFSRGLYIFSSHATGILGEAVRGRRRGVDGLGLGPSHSLRRTGQYNNNNKNKNNNNNINDNNNNSNKNTFNEYLDDVAVTDCVENLFGDTETVTETPANEY